MTYANLSPSRRLALCRQVERTSCRRVALSYGVSRKAIWDWYARTTGYGLTGRKVKFHKLRRSFAKENAEYVADLLAHPFAGLVLLDAKTNAVLVADPLLLVS